MKSVSQVENATGKSFGMPSCTILLTEGTAESWSNHSQWTDMIAAMSSWKHLSALRCYRWRLCWRYICETQQHGSRHCWYYCWRANEEGEGNFLTTSRKGIIENIFNHSTMWCQISIIFNTMENAASWSIYNFESIFCCIEAESGFWSLKNDSKTIRKKLRKHR